MAFQASMFKRFAFCGVKYEIRYFHAQEVKISDHDDFASFSLNIYLAKIY